LVAMRARNRAAMKAYKEEQAKPERLDKLLEKAGFRGGQTWGCVDGSRHYLKGYLKVCPERKRRKADDYEMIGFRLIPQPDGSVSIIVDAPHFLKELVKKAGFTIHQRQKPTRHALTMYQIAAGMKQGDIDPKHPTKVIKQKTGLKLVG